MIPTLPFGKTTSMLPWWRTMFTSVTNALSKPDHAAHGSHRCANRFQSQRHLHDLFASLEEHHANTVQLSHIVYGTPNFGCLGSIYSCSVFRMPTNWEETSTSSLRLRQRSHTTMANDTRKRWLTIMPVYYNQYTMMFGCKRGVLTQPSDSHFLFWDSGKAV